MVGGGVLEHLTCLRNRARCKILGVICWKFREILASFAGAPVTPREGCHVTQPRARINVSCSRADHKGGTGGHGDLKNKNGGGENRYRTRVSESGTGTA